MASNGKACVQFFLQSRFKHVCSLSSQVFLLADIAQQPTAVSWSLVCKRAGPARPGPVSAFTLPLVSCWPGLDPMLLTSGK